MHFQYPEFILTSWLLVLTSHTWMISYLYLLAFPFIIFLFPILGFFFFPPWELPLAFVITLVWWWRMIKNLPEMQELMFDPWVGKVPWKRGMAPHSSIPAWRIPGTEEPGGYSPWGYRESDMTKHLSLQWSWHVCVWVYPAWDSLYFLGWVTVSFFVLGNILPIISSNDLSGPFSLLCLGSP